MSLPTRRLLVALTSLALLLTGAGGAAAAIYGPDVSSYQHPSGYSIGWSSAKASGSATFGFVKATEGTGYTNPWFSTDFASMASTGIMRGAYHFANPAQSASAQASYFVSVAGRFNRVGDLPPVLDLETTGGLSPSALVAWTATWLQTVKSLTGRTPMIYTGPYFWQSAMGNSRAFTGYPLWIASYGVSSPQVPGGWPSWTFWQYTSSASLSGVSGAVDMNVFNGTLAQLQTLAGGTPAPVAPAGSFDGVGWDGQTLVAGGWALDPQTATPLPVTLTVDGRTAATVTATTARADVGRAYPTAGPNHGFTTDLVASPGSHSVCASTVNAARVPLSLGCRTASVPVTAPFGTLDGAGWAGTALTLGGWAIDTHTTGPATVSVQLDGVTVRTLSAGGSRPDVATAYPDFGANHGYSVALPAAPGSHKVCVTAVGSGTGNTKQLGCTTVTVPVTPPFGSLDGAGWTGRALSVGGWAVDPATAAPIQVSVTVDGTPAGPSTTAAKARPDIATAYPASGPNHGYDALVPSPAGSHLVCVSAANVTASLTRQLGCTTVAVPATPPFGTVDVAAWKGTSLFVGGWAVDPATASPISVTVTVDGAPAATVPASSPRPDIAGIAPAAGPNHGYGAWLPAGPGTRQVCATATNQAGTLHQSLGCRTVAVPAVPPLGSVDLMRWSGTTINAVGWALSPATAAPIPVTMSIDQHLVATTVGTSPRGDVGALFPAQGPNHGYSVSAPAAPGPHTVCLTGIGTGSRQLGCRTFVVPQSLPIGSADVLTWNGSALAGFGWAIDPDVASPISVVMTVDGKVAGTTTADAVRTDVGRAYPAYGPNHGFAVTAPAAPGPHTVCLVAKNAGAGSSDKVLFCRALVVPRSQPIGSLDAVSWTGSALRVTGWAIDLDVTAPISVAVTVDRSAPVTVTASTSRADVGRAYPGYGALHGFDWSTSLSRGSHTVCVTALNTGAGTTDTPLGCRTVVRP